MGAVKVTFPAVVGLVNQIGRAALSGAVTQQLQKILVDLRQRKP